MLTEHTVDLAVLTRDERPLSPTVSAALRDQRGVKLRIHRIIGKPQTDDANRVATIARARNEAVGRARSPWLMFLDDDVALAPDCVARLHHALASRPEYGAFAADYLGEANACGSSPHVAMGATMFRRSTLQRTTFRWEPNKCECLCCCEDLRRQGARVEYLTGARAWHLAKTQIACDPSRPQVTNAADQGDPRLSAKAIVLAAFNRRDVKRFRDAYLRSLRSSGNQQQLIVVAYGLYPSELRLLSALPGVRVIAKRVNGQMPPVRRLTDFADVVTQLAPDTPVAYWDASDVIFQGSLDPLWQLTQQHPEKLLAVREPRGYPYNRAIAGWTRTIRDPNMRRRAFELFSTHPFLNSGFAAGTAAVMKRYFVEASRLRESAELRGTTDWGDQTALNLYCHSDPSRWQEIPPGWNYCVHDRPHGEVHVTPAGRVVSSSGTPIHVAHGNARSLAKLAIIH
jgi:hypothetical protein